jgi:L-ascorbate metabolism protein UlaG (beta-lactamase superfamily)
MLTTMTTLTHVGGPTMVVEIDGWRIVTDPTFDAAGRTYGFGWGTHGTKVAGPAVRLEDLGPVDAVLLTHDQHADNLDDAGRAFLPSARTVLTTVSGARRLGGNAIGLEAGHTTTLEDGDRQPLTVTATPCRHGPLLSHSIVGDAIGFSIKRSGTAETAVWISGDTVLYDDLRAVARRMTVDVAIVHLGAVRFGLTGPAHYTLSAPEGVELLGLLRPRVTVPVHYEGWSHFREGRDVLEPALAATGADVRWLELGTPTEVGRPQT